MEPPKNPEQILLQNEKILLRPILLGDIENFYAITKDPDLWIWFTHDLSDPVELKHWVESAILEAKQGARIPFTIVVRETMEIAGSTSIGNISIRDARAEIGWTWLGKKFQGQGINDQIKILMLDYCFNELKMERVEFKTDVLNVYARRALLRIGAREEGILRSHTLMTHGRRRDTIFYSFLLTEWINHSNTHS